MLENRHIGFSAKQNEIHTRLSIMLYSRKSFFEVSKFFAN